jgi:hypothetical protein
MDINKIVNTEHIPAFFDLIGKASSMTSAESDRMEATAKVNKIMGAFMRRPEKIYKESSKFHMATSDIPVSITDNASIFRNVGNYDLGYEQAFMDVQLEEGRGFWEIEDLTDAVTFRKIPEGGRVQVEGMASTLSFVRTDAYGGAIGWTHQMITDRKWPLMQQKAMAFRDAEGQKKTNGHYQLLSATLSGSNTTSYDATGSTEKAKDINTLNNAGFALANGLKDAYVGDPLQQEVLVYCNPTLWSRIGAALRETTQDIAGQPSQVPYNFRYILSFNDYLTSSTGGSTATNALMVFPGYKNQKATKTQPTSYFEFDPLTRSYIQAVWTDYGAAATASQTRLVNFA